LRMAADSVPGAGSAGASLAVTGSASR
jgi:hypothetical protein